MRKPFVIALATIATTAAAATAGAQEQTSVVTGHAASFTVTPYAGYMSFGSLNDVGGLRQSFDNRAVVGAQAGLSLTRNLSVVGNLAHSTTRPVVKATSGGAQYNASASDVNLWLYDANLEYKVPASLPLGAASVRPFVQGGAGAVRYTSADAAVTSSGKNYVALNGGVGADVQFAGPVGLRVMAKDYVTSMRWDRASDVSLNGGESQRAHNIALTAGVKIGF